MEDYQAKKVGWFAGKHDLHADIDEYNVPNHKNNEGTTTGSVVYNSGMTKEERESKMKDMIDFLKTKWVCCICYLVHHQYPSTCTHILLWHES